ncbi:unnamed protein product [Ectocarpus sp. 12 AP-2014]
MIAAGILRRSHSEWASPVVCVMKKNGSVRVTANLKLNDATVVPCSVLPNMSECIDQFRGSAVFFGGGSSERFFSSINSRRFYPLTAIVTSTGLYEFVRVPMGASGAPNHFQLLMAKVFDGLEKKVVFE